MEGNDSPPGQGAKRLRAKRGKEASNKWGAHLGKNAFPDSKWGAHPGKTAFSDNKWGAHPGKDNRWVTLVTWRSTIAHQGRGQRGWGQRG